MVINALFISRQLSLQLAVPTCTTAYVNDTCAGAIYFKLLMNGQRLRIQAQRPKALCYARDIDAEKYYRVIDE